MLYLWLVDPAVRKKPVREGRPGRLRSPILTTCHMGGDHRRSTPCFGLSASLPGRRAKPVTDDHGGSYAPQRGNAERDDNRGHQPGTIRAMLARRLEYLSFGQDDADLLHSLQPVVQQHSDDIVRAFYEHLIAFETTRNLLHDEATMNRLVEAQKRHVVELFGGVYDERYAERRLVVGKVPANVVWVQMG